MYPGYNYSPFDMMGYQMPQRGLSSLFKGLGGSRGGLGATSGILGAATKAKFNWGGLLTNTQKTLGIINQAIPIFYQVRPIWNNAKVMLNVMNAVKDDSPSVKSSKATTQVKTVENNNTSTKPISQEGKPSFFI